MMLLAATSLQAQITIGGHVYGGGNAGDTGGNTTVTVHAGDLNRVFGGARMADVSGRAFVNIDGAHASNYIVINRLYGGNDIAGTIGTSDVDLPAVVADHAATNGVDKTWNALVLISSKISTPATYYTAEDQEVIDGNKNVGDIKTPAIVAEDNKPIYIGQLFGGGDGEYEYGKRTEDDIYYAKEDDVEVATSSTELTPPLLGKTFVDIHGGSIVYAYGGGNNATVTVKTVISLDNPSAVVSSIIDASNPNAGAGGELLTNDRFEKQMGINMAFTYPSSDAFQIGRLFGGNNKADMAIRPRWNLQRGSVRNLYGGGNEGRMTTPEGLLLQIKGEGMKVDNVFGGCRKSDVRPLYNNNDATPVPDEQIQLDPNDNPGNIPGGYSARVRVLAGDVNNVYGGNDISGNVYGGNTVGIFTNIHGNVYGGGNGSYAYTDNVKLKDDPKWSDFYYSPKDILGLDGNSFTGLQSAEALNIFRPNAEKVSVLVRGTDEKPVFIEGALYVGGNSASLRDQSNNTSTNTHQTHIKIGSYVTIDNVFLGNNGENMVKYEGDDEFSKGEGVLRTFARTFKDPDNNDAEFSQMDLTVANVFAKYMEGCAMKVKPTVVFESKANGDPHDYVPYTTKFGSFYCGGNVGSILVDGKISIDFNDEVIIYDKVVGGCNNANVNETAYNAQYLGGMIGNPDPVPVGSPEGTIGDKLELNFGGLKIQPKRWNADKTELIWNTIKASTGEEVTPTNLQPGTSNAEDLDRRFKGGNIYGGCYNTGHVNGNVIINLNASIVDRKGVDAIFDQVEQNEGEAILYGHDSYNITERKSGVLLDEQGMDVLGKALNVFGGGYGAESEIWGSTTINLNAGYTFQIFGGGEKGAIGKKNNVGQYEYNPKYSCYVNMKGSNEGVYRGHVDDSDDMAEAEFIYGGSFEAPIAGNTVINLGNGRLFNSFAGSCNADILGHTETYIGRNGVDANGQDVPGFPWVRDHVYGGNDLGGEIKGSKSFIDRVENDVKGMVHNPDGTAFASAYMEYIQGRVDNIFGGCYGDYDYKSAYFKDYTYTGTGESKHGFTKPRLNNAFVNFHPNTHARNAVTRIFGAGQGCLKGIGVDSMQHRSYVLVQIPQNIMKYQNVEVFGAGANCGLGMGVAPNLLVTQPDQGSAIIDLVRGQISAAYGGSFQEGITRRTMINVPDGSTIKLDNIFGGAYGADPMYPCDVYEAQVNYHSESARVKTIYGGNNSADRTLYGQVNISVPVWQNKESGYLATVYGAGYGADTWSQYTEVNLNGNADPTKEGARVYEVYGGGNNGKVVNLESLRQWRYNEGESFDLSIPGYEAETIYKDKDNKDFRLDAGLDSPLAHAVSLNGQKYNTNVHIHQGATVVNYAYGGGKGVDAVVSGTTYIDLLGGTVKKDIYAGGTSGAVQDFYKVGAKSVQNPYGFTATATAYIEGGTLRNVFGGGWEGDVGYHDKTTTEIPGDILGETNVVIGIREDQTTLPAGYGYYKGVPAIQRNAYSGGEGGSVYGTANLIMNNGYIGYTYNSTAGKYEEKIDDETWTDGVGKDRLADCGNLFGGGYDDNSSVDFTNVTVWGGLIRNSIFGGGEIATIGRGKTRETGTDNKVRTLDAIYKAGRTHIEMYNGHVKRNIFGGGKGYNILGYGGTRGFYTDGYVFGKTEVYVHGGEIGTPEGVADGYGNVFGGGDVGFVYSGSYLTGSHDQGTGSPNHYYYKDNEGHLTEDCKVVISPMLQIKKTGSSVYYGGKTYQPYDYVPTEYLNTLPAEKTDSKWQNLYMGEKQTPDDMVERGVHIHNAVFAGGNVSSNSESYSNATTVFGNTTATLYDVYHHDFITVGTEHTGGLYGGGNLSLVGGYRELNITNYGTDYYGLGQQITLEEYGKLTNRERAYFKLEYLCKETHSYGGKDYTANESRITEEEYNAIPANTPAGQAERAKWEQYGFCSIYAGRLLNTIQRADFCGVFGSRLVLQGAKDRVADVADATEYTINRIGELSLNQQRFVPNDDSQIHGNYFGIYSIVNYLGNLTSDVRFVDDKRRYMNNGQVAEDTKTYYQYKVDNLTKRDRNNGTSWNQVALASGVYLELTTENSTPSKKIYGDITGVVELDLINVKKDIEGGGYVYARNEHGQWHEVSDENTLLSSYNMKDGDRALTKKIYTYDTDAEHLFSYQTSGNFIHKSKRIVDDCYPNNGVYNDDKGVYVTSPAHYWFIKGEVYIYDQVVSAYAGSAAAYSKEVKIPLTITAGSNGKLKLLNVQPSLYAYYGDQGRTSKMDADGVKVDNESMTYKLNDVITWWDWHQLAQSEQNYFVKETRVNVEPCKIGGTLYDIGEYVLEDDPSIHGGDASETDYQKFLLNHPDVLDSNNQPVTDLTKLFHSSNNIGHDTGYVLTLDMNSPKDWDDWYSPILRNGGDKISKETYNGKSAEDQAKYREGPTYKLTGASGLYGQRQYSVGEVISKEVYEDYTYTFAQMPPEQRPSSGQATAERAYVALEDFGNTQAGNAIGKTAYDALSDKSKFALAMVCINSIQVGEEEYVLMGELVSGKDEDLLALAQKFRTYNNSKINADPINDDAQALEYVKANLSDAYYINSEGLFGGQYYDATKNYSAIKSWSTLTDDRTKFEFNYDAFDVLVAPTYPGEGHTDVYAHPYDEEKSVEYEAVYNGENQLTYYDNDNTSHTISSGGSITREAYEKVRNDQLHYTRIAVDAGNDTQTVYIVTENIINKGTPYAKGQDISEKDYNSLTGANQNKVDVVNIPKEASATVKYYCYENYTPKQGSSVSGQKGSVISNSVFNDNINVLNYQKNFSIQGAEPTETTTLYVSRESNAKDVTSEKVISVVYQYTYYEADDEGEGVSLVNELHVVNIHLQLESGAPEIGQLTAPPAVLPGNTVGLKAPSVNPGLYEILTSGWELFNNEQDAENHLNGVPFTNNGTPLYWYQNQKVFLAFYSKTYLGKTYSNYVPLTVANYHDLDAVMKDKEHHLYVDHPGVARNSKIYIDNRECESDPTKSELDLLKDFFDLSVSGLTGHASLDEHVKGGADLEFILNSNVSPKAYTDWTPIGNNTQCFGGTLHGDGYTISGLNHSLFGNLCGNVYNLGVTGPFTSAGVVDTGDGYVENCWINPNDPDNPDTPVDNVGAVFGNPSRGSGIQIVNCYYPSNKSYSTSDSGRGLATPMTKTQFYNGTVTFNLNGFYLNKRYHDHVGLTSGTKYKYLKDENGTLSETPITAFYPASPAAQYGDVGYVEERYADGDFIYAGGTIPEAYDERMRVVTEETTSTVTYAPIWPDDYIFFGQSLNYGHSKSQAHQDWPTHIVKSEGRLPVTESSNRVYRAPAYYQSKEKSVAHFNLYAYLAAQSAPKTITDTNLRDAYPNMTAIDFAGHNDNAWSLGGSTHFYPPLLDNEDGLQNIVNEGETPNLLVYAPATSENLSDPNNTTHQALTTYFVDPVYTSYYINDAYRRVGPAPATSVHGHLVQHDLTATNDHLLVDKRDFNCPISYTFANDKHMWYQRTPDLYVDKDKGWDIVSLPFTAELVTTHQKGEITHFYSGSRKVDGETEIMIGNEYWLREYEGQKPGTTITDGIFTAAFNYPGASGADKKTVGNTFLWDYYYKNNSLQDANTDAYQSYYESSRIYDQYPLLTAAKPYIIGFPGETYYEFDLSGGWTAANTKTPAPAQLEKQTISFVSVPNTTIKVSDSELSEVTANGYCFKPNYMSKTVEAEAGYLMNSVGNRFDVTTEPMASVPFRPYFVKAPVGTRGDSRNAVKHIIFDGDDSSFVIDEDDPSKEEIATENMIFTTRRHEIIVTSYLRKEADVRIYNIGGIMVASFTILPGESISTYVPVSGVYIVRAAEGRYQKKLAVK